MNVSDAQREVRSVYLGGSVGQWVSGVIWLLSAGLWTWGSPRAGILALVLGGAFIFPLTQLALRASGRPASLSAGTGAALGPAERRVPDQPRPILFRRAANRGWCRSGASRNDPLTAYTEPVPVS